MAICHDSNWPPARIIVKPDSAIFPSAGLSMTLHRENPPAEPLGLLYRVSRALLREGEYGELLSGLLDTLIEGLGADRGFVVVREAAEIRATTARNFRSGARYQGEQAFSRSIARTDTNFYFL